MALRLKKLGNTIQEVIGGRAVHPVNYVIGGFGKVPSTDDLLLLQTGTYEPSCGLRTHPRDSEGR